jgi:hypothetical protein
MGTVPLLSCLLFGIRVVISNADLIKNPDTGTSYKYVHYLKTWNNARSTCQSMNAVLVTINSEAENNFTGRLAAKSVMSNYNRLWIGLRFKYQNRSHGNDTIWASNSTFKYDSWWTGEPNDVDGIEDCVEMIIENEKYNWNDVKCDVKRPFICEIVNCSSPARPKYGTAHYTDSIYLSDVNFTCNEGFYNNGTESAVCLANGSWSDTTPQCLSIVCHDWTEFNYSCYKFYDQATLLDSAESNCVSHGGHVASILSEAENDFLSNFQDDQDIWLGLYSTSLNDNKWWRDGNPVSYTNWWKEPTKSEKFAKLIVPDDRNGQWQSVSDTNKKLAYICKKGYRCGATLRDPSYGRVSRYNVTVGSTAIFSCENGYRLVGNSAVICQLNSLWNGTTPTCEIVDCGHLTLPNGYVNVSSTTYKSLVHFSCLRDYILVGNKSAVCLANGRWNTSIPICKLKETNKEISDAANVADLSSAVASLSLDKFSSQTAENAISKLENFTSEYNLTSSQVQKVVHILDTLTQLGGQALERGKAVTVSNAFVEVRKHLLMMELIHAICYLFSCIFIQTFVEVADNLLDTQTKDSWLSLDSNEGAPALLESMEDFGRLVAFSSPTNDTKSLVFSSNNILLTVNTVDSSTVTNLSFPVDVVSRSTSAIHVPTDVLNDVLNSTETKQIGVVSLAFNNLQDLMPPTTTQNSRNTSESVRKLRTTTKERLHTSIVSLSIVEIGKSYSSRNSKFELNTPIEINYMNIQPVENGNYTCSFWEFGSDSTPGYWSSLGVTTEIRSDTNIVCNSFHLTSFSVLVSVQDPSVSPTSQLYIYFDNHASVCLDF